MVKKLVKYAWSLRREFTKYFIVGFSGFFLDMSLLIFVKQIFSIRPVFALICTQVVLVVYNFTLNKYWSFRNKEMPHKQFVRYFILAIWNYTFGIIIMFLLNEKIGIDYKLVRVFTLSISISWNFLLFKYWVYRSDPPRIIVEAKVSIKEV